MKTSISIEAEDPELVEHDRPRKEEDRLDVEDDEEDGDQVVADGEPVVEGVGRRPRCRTRTARASSAWA